MPRKLYSNPFGDGGVFGGVEVENLEEAEKEKKEKKKKDLEKKRKDSKTGGKIGSAPKKKKKPSIGDKMQDNFSAKEVKEYIEAEKKKRDKVGYLGNLKGGFGNESNDFKKAMNRQRNK